MTYFTYLDFPKIPTDLIEQILYYTENPISNFHDTDQFLDYVQSNSRDNLNIAADPSIVEAITGLEIDWENSLGYPISEATKYFENLAHFDFLEVNEDLNNWARENISQDIAYVSIQSMYGGTTITPHIDEMRSFAYNYVIDTGGESRTVFYKAKKEFSHLTAYPQTIFPYDKLDIIEKISIEKNKWHKLNTSVIHSVENLDPNKKRISLSLSFL